MKILILLLLLLPTLASAREAQPLAENPLTEARVLAMANELRCLVCQNQTLADSHSELAGDLRREMRGMIEKGMSDQDIVAYMVSRYGDFVLYRPPLKPATLALWFGPFLLLAGGAMALLRNIRARRRQLATQPGMGRRDPDKVAALLRDNGGTP